MPVLLLLALLLVTPTDPALESAASAMHRLLRDSTEIPLLVRSTVEFYDASGRLRKSKRTEHRFQITAIKHSDQGVTYNFVLKKVDKAVFADLVDTDSALFANLLLFSFPTSDEHFDVSSEPTSTTLTVSVSAPADCTEFEVEKGKFRLKRWCGSSQVVFDREPLVPRHATCTAAGLPLAGPKDTLRAYRAELDLQLITLPGDSRPLLLPQRIVATYESDRGRTVVQSDYTPAHR
jgi:hypothetical protein